MNREVSLKTIISGNRAAISGNLLLLAVEITLMALVPLFIGYSIDGLLSNTYSELWYLIGVLISLIVISMIRRFYDTRAYGKIRVQVQSHVAKSHQGLGVSVLNARLEMARELVDFMEEQMPDLLNGIVQFIVSLTVLFFLHPLLALSAAIVATVMIAIYALYHRGFYRFNQGYNAMTERKVKVLETGVHSQFVQYFQRLKNLEVKLSDREAWLYGMVFFVLLAMVVFNLWYATTAMAVTAGSIFSIVSYSWEFVEAAILLPMTLQSLTRLSEITQRLQQSKAEINAANPSG